MAWPQRQLGRARTPPPKGCTTGMIGPTFPDVLAAAARGDEDAVGTLWHDLQPALLSYLQVIAPRAAEDLASETWLRVVRDFGRFRGDERAFRAWFFTIARHRAIDWQRWTSRQATEPVPVEALSDWPAPDDPAATAAEALSAQAALALIATLPADQAEAITLRVVAGLGATETGQIMGKRPGTVRVLVHRGLRRLAERLVAGVHVRGRV
jgi:RNA polymerase sigma-70 factor (ECF subfamily)